MGSWRDRPVVLVAGRELRDRLARKGYWIFLAISMVAVAALVAIPSLVSGGGDTVTVAVVTSSPDAAALRVAVEEAGGTDDLTVVLRNVDDESELNEAVRDGTVAIGVAGVDRLVVKDRPTADDSSGTAQLVGAIATQLRIRTGLESAGITADQFSRFTQTPAPEVVALERDDGDRTARRLTATVINVLLLMMLQLYGSWVLNGVTEEKTSRVAEVLLAGTGPRPLLSGKLIGVGIAALVNGVALVAAALVAVVASRSTLLDQIDVATLLWGLAWLMLGYGFYCCVYASVGATVTRVEEAQSASFPVLLPVLFTYLLAFGVVWADTAPLYYQILGYLPPTAPIAMAVMQASGQATWWQGLISMVICVIGIVWMTRLAAGIYRGSILHTGGRIKFRDALRNED
ncbi:MAG TPA: ABC transporter permease, partial [Microthrixaceae bacterium]|nr:ABC transporter permease [Microthrixaceae bacterium]